MGDPNSRFSKATRVDERGDKADLKAGMSLEGRITSAVPQPARVSPCSAELANPLTRAVLPRSHRQHRARLGPRGGRCALRAARLAGGTGALKVSLPPVGANPHQQFAQLGTRPVADRCLAIVLTSSGDGSGSLA
jgi:hypothetical protein